MAALRRPGRALLLAVAASTVLSYCLRCFVPTPQSSQDIAAQSQLNVGLAVSAALPTLTMLAEDAEAKYGDQRRWSAVLVPLTSLVFPIVVFGTFTLYAFTEDVFWKLLPSKRGVEQENAWRENPLTANIRDPLNGFINIDDYEKGLEEAWERAKPAGSTVTAKDKLAQLSKQNNPHFQIWRKQLSA
eukprot:TRINITY_DN3233_c1_g3_i1.p1 TRINITY_DN3233_c1_g3~~TRINITY_DN3233_c1_g3_i1.p1  ORF type:complete len:198 (-),score=31.38 TRINITY_DN3233_c1_g3_i1:145-705(-)